MAGPTAQRGSHMLSEGDNSNTNDGGGGGSSGDDDPNSVRRSRQDRRVCYIRGALIAVLFIVAIVVASFAGLYVKHDERTNFLMQYTDSFDMMEEVFQSRLDVMRDSAMTMSAVFTSQYGPMGVFPNVTMPNFE